MKLREWRKKYKLSQTALAKELEEHARTKFDQIKSLQQSTVGYWERGTLPRKKWLVIIDSYTKGKVSASDFALQIMPQS